MFELHGLFEENFESSCFFSKINDSRVTSQRRHYVKQQRVDEDGIANDAAQSEMLIFKTRRSAATYFQSC
jgi:hypothetical protein